MQATDQRGSQQQNRNGALHTVYIDSVNVPTSTISEWGKFLTCHGKCWQVRNLPHLAIFNDYAGAVSAWNCSAAEFKQ